ncbi:hypothetical protein O181_028904 [Austropuccinia psidii MF-1]|uniref:Uncharacterized protein n=1 Tax=Austropuccinia psidii MF-1 TaxID=1389203 RepID=A0A9Q3H426_9BASI|nr:hypothetical protein [Austropuccinia psidii MF-1]
MTIVHKDVNINENTDGLSRWELTNTPDNISYDPENSEPRISIEGINIMDVETEFFEEVRESYKPEKNCHILTSLPEKNSNIQLWLILWMICGKLHIIMEDSIYLMLTNQPQTYELAKRIIQTLEDVIRRFCAYGMELKDSDGFNHDWFTLIPELELAYKSSIHALTGQNSSMLKKGCNPKLPVDTLKKDLVDIQPN